MAGAHAASRFARGTAEIRRRLTLRNKIAVARRPAAVDI